MDSDRELDLPERLAHIADYVPKDRCVRCGRLSEVPRARAADGTMTRDGPFCTRCWGHYERRHNPAYVAATTAGRRKYEALLRGATPPGVTIYLDAVAERDGWICQLCDEPVDPEADRHSAAGASMDHRIPVSRGGTHTMDNVQLAHRGCNSRKKDRLPGERPKYGSEDSVAYLRLQTVAVKFRPVSIIM